MADNRYELCFYYNRQLIGTSDVDDIECDAFCDLMENNREVAQGVLDFLNSLGDPLIPYELDEVDIVGLYAIFMHYLYLAYLDWGEIYIDEIPGCEIYTQTDNDLITCSTKPRYLASMVNATSEENVPLASEVANKLRFADGLIRTFLGKNEFDPFAELEGSEDMSQKLYVASVDFYQAVQDAVDKFDDDTSFYVGLK